MDFNLDCNVAFRRLSSKLSMSYLGFLLLVISCFIYFFCFIEQTSVFHQKVGYQISFINEILFQDGKTRVNILLKKKNSYTYRYIRGLYIKSSPHFLYKKIHAFPNVYTFREAWEFQKINRWKSCTKNCANLMKKQLKKHPLEELIALKI